MPDLVYANVRVHRIIMGDASKLTSTPGFSAPADFLVETAGIHLSADGRTVSTQAVPQPDA